MTEIATADLRSVSKITGDLVFTVDEAATELSVEAQIAEAVVVPEHRGTSYGAGAMAPRP